MIGTPPEQGQLVRVRQRQWVVSGVTKSTLPLTPLHALNGHSQHLVTLSSIEDDGLGKTIEAGMTILELILRHRARRVLVVCPAALQIQWQEQMRDKFGLDFRIVDSDLMKELRRKRGIHANPWTHFPRLITSIDFLKRERPLRLFTETLPTEGESLYPRRYDILVADEAHHSAPAGGGQY